MAVVAVVMAFLALPFVAGGVVVVPVVVVAVGMHDEGRRVAVQVPVHAGRHRPGKLERNDEHDDQGDEATHEPDCTDTEIFTKRLVLCIRSAGPSRGQESMTRGGTGLHNREDASAVTPADFPKPALTACQHPACLPTRLCPAARLVRDNAKNKWDSTRWRFANPGVDGLHCAAC